MQVRYYLVSFAAGHIDGDRDDEERRSLRLPAHAGDYLTTVATDGDCPICGGLVINTGFRCLVTPSAGVARYLPRIGT